jgi:phosphoenolpyruvate-protein kinase (PTS system EI component)
MGMNDLYQKQCKEEKEQLEKSLADIITMISMLETGVKQYPENTSFELSKFYRRMLKDAQLGKEACEKRIAELSEKIE